MNSLITCKLSFWTKAKAEAYNTYIAPQAAYRNCRSAGHVTHRAGVGPMTNQPHTVWSAV